MVKKTPSEEQLRDTVKKLLEEADLEEMTMKQICQRVRTHTHTHTHTHTPLMPGCWCLGV